MTALIVGASGLVGGCLLREVSAGGYTSALALVRRPLATPTPGIDECLVDFDQLDSFRQPTTDVFCALGTTIRKAGSQAAFRRVDFDYPLRLARRAIQLGAQQFLLVSSVGASPHSSNFYLRVKGELEVELAQCGFPSLHVFRPGVLLGPRPEQRSGEAFGKLLSVLLQPLLAGPLQRYRAMPADRLARAMVAAARRREPGQHVYHYREIDRLASASGL
jgi:uncharacterized protein YbjT (DUF2867 family)